MDRKKIILRKLSKMSKDRMKRVYQFKRMVMNMPYTETHYIFKKNPNAMFEEEENQMKVK